MSYEKTEPQDDPWTVLLVASIAVPIAVVLLVIVGAITYSVNTVNFEEAAWTCRRMCEERIPERPSECRVQYTVNTACAVQCVEAFLEGREMGRYNKPGLTVETAAILLDDVIHTLPRPARHHDIIRKLAAEGHPTPIQGVQGFVLSDGQFATRKVARLVAKRAGQVPKSPTPPGPFTSEELW